MVSGNNNRKETGFTAPTCSAPSPAHLPRTWAPRGPLPNFRMTAWRLEKNNKNNNAEGLEVTGLVREGGLNIDDPRGPVSVVSGALLVWERAWSRLPPVARVGFGLSRVRAAGPELGRRRRQFSL